MDFESPPDVWWRAASAVDVDAEASSLLEDGREVPAHVDVLPDGRTTVVLGDVSDAAERAHRQGDNSFCFAMTCGLCSCRDVLAQFGIEVTENDVVAHALATGNCEVASDAAGSGGTTADMQARILTDLGVPAHVERGESLEDLAANLEHGRGVIIGLNAGVLWDDPSYYEFGHANHAVVPTGVARDPETGRIQGFFINDSGTGTGGSFIDASTMTTAWLDTGGGTVVTDVRPGGTQ